MNQLRLLLAIPLLAISAAAKPAVPKFPHVLVILADDMGYGDAGCYNPHSKIPTPHIDRLAAEGMRFTDAHAAGPLCHPSRYGLMTGRYPFRTDVSRWPTEPLIGETQMTVASLLSGKGYDTTLIGKWHLGFTETGYDKRLAGGPVDRGFDHFFGLRASTDIPPYFFIRQDRAVTLPTDTIGAVASAGWSPIQGEFRRAGKIAPDLDLSDVLGRLTSEACTAIRQHADAGDGRPMFLYLGLTAPHTPWLPAPEFVGKSGAGMYGDFTTMVDAQVGLVLETLQRAGMSEETLVVFSSDNGPVWYPQDVKRLGHDAVGGLRGMKGDAWEGGHRMPFIVRWPGRVHAGKTTGHMVCFTDMLATLAEIVGTPLPADAGPDSFSFLPVLDGRTPTGIGVRSTMVMQAGDAQTMSIRSGDWKLIDRSGSGGFSGPEKPAGDAPAGQLYNLRDDPAESTNLYLVEPERVARLKREMHAIVRAPASRLR